MTDFLVSSLNAIIPVLVLIILFFVFFSLTTVMEYQRGLKFQFGRFTGTLKGGMHLLFRYTQHIKIVDTRPCVLAITGQEILTSDGITVKTSVTTQYQIVDPKIAVTGVEDFQKALHQTVQLAIREIIGSQTIDELLENRSQFADKLMEMCRDKTARFGLELQLIDVKDIMLPADLRTIFSQIVQARKQGMAALERARGETAALRNLANSAKMLENNPNLLQLRILSAMSESVHNTFVVGLGENAGLLPKIQNPISGPV